MNSYKQTDTAVQPTAKAPSYSDRQFLHTYQSAAFLPLIQSTINAGMGMLVTGVALYMFDAMDFFKPIISVGVLVWVGSWMYLQRRWFNLTDLETRLNVDLNQDGMIGKSEQREPTVVRIQDVTDDGHWHEKRAKLPISEEELVSFADGVINRHKPISRREWTPKAKGFSDGDWREFQSAMIKFGIIEQVGAGFELTRAGRAVMKHYASLSPTPLVEVVEE